MKILIAGSNTRNVSDYCKWYGVPKLYSFMNEKSQIDTWDDNYLLMVDSGAHSWNKETITKIGLKRGTKLKPAAEFIETYFEYVKQNCMRKLVFVEFDVYGHLPMNVIDRFYDRVMELNPVAKFMRVYHPVLDGGSLEVMKKWIAQGHEYIGVGNDSTDILGKIFHLTRDKVRIHGFAMTKLDLMHKYPFFSVDSTSPLATVIFGRYTVPIMNKIERQEVYEMKSIECFHDDWRRLELAVIETAETQDYVTALWAKKGIVWKELQF